jgi:hypothetical protein
MYMTHGNNVSRNPELGNGYDRLAAPHLAHFNLREGCPVFIQQKVGKAMIANRKIPPSAVIEPRSEAH